MSLNRLLVYGGLLNPFMNTSIINSKEGLGPFERPSKTLASVIRGTEEILHSQYLFSVIPQYFEDIPRFYRNLCHLLDTRQRNRAVPIYRMSSSSNASASRSPFGLCSRDHRPQGTRRSTQKYLMAEMLADIEKREMLAENLRQFFGTTIHG